MTAGVHTHTTIFFMIFFAIIVVVIVRFGRVRSTRSDYYVGGRAFTTPQNGLALFGTFLMMTSFLALSGEIALRGYDAVLFAVSFVVSWLVALLLIAEPLRNTGRFTLGDALSVRMRDYPVRLAAAVVTLVVFFFYMTIQLVGAGSLVELLFNIKEPAGQAMVIAVIGVLTAIIVYYGGMPGTTWTQIIKAALLFTGVTILAVALLAHYRLNVSALLGDAAANSGSGGEQLLMPGTKFGEGGLHKLEFVSQVLTAVLGHAALPYLFMRFLTVPTARQARSSVAWAIWLICPYYLFVILIGFGAAALVGPEMIESAPGHRVSAAPLLASKLGGAPLLAFIAAVVLITIIAVTAALAISAATSFTRDIYANMLRKQLEEGQEVAVARRAVVVLCLLMTVCGILLMRQNVGFMLSLDVTVVASSILPTLLYSWFWRGFNTLGVLWSMYGGLVVTVVLVTFSPAISGNPTALFPDADFAIFPWKYVGLASIPLSFLLGYLGSKLSKEHDDAKFAEMEVRALTGAGAAKPVPAGQAPQLVGAQLARSSTSEGNSDGRDTGLGRRRWAGRNGNGTGTGSPQRAERHRGTEHRDDDPSETGYREHPQHGTARPAWRRR